MAMDSLLEIPFINPLFVLPAGSTTNDDYNVSEFVEQISIPSLFGSNISKLCDKQVDASKDQKLLHRTGGI